MRRTLLFFAFLLLTFVGVKAQTPREITGGTIQGTAAYIPYDNRGLNSFCEMIYLGSEISQTGDITAVAFNVSNDATLSNQNLSIYMGMSTLR